MDTRVLILLILTIEDVQSFHDNIVAPPAGKRATRGQTTKKAPVAVESSDESDEDGGSYGQPRRKVSRALSV